MQLPTRFRPHWISRSRRPVRHRLHGPTTTAPCCRTAGRSNNLGNRYPLRRFEFADDVPIVGFVGRCKFTAHSHRPFADYLQMYFNQVASILETGSVVNPFARRDGGFRQGDEFGSVVVYAHIADRRVALFLPCALTRRRHPAPVQRHTRSRTLRSGTQILMLRPSSEATQGFCGRKPIDAYRGEMPALPAARRHQNVCRPGQFQ